MAKKFPRFLYSDPTNVKEKGPYIVHTLDPQFICTPKFDNKRHIVDMKILTVFKEGYDYFEVYSMLDEIKEWYKYSGIYQSNNADDKVVGDIMKLEFLKDYKSEYTVEQARKLIQILFPSKAKNIYEGSTSYGLKHLFEHVSQTVMETRYGNSKYCSNNTLIDAFELEGFRMKAEGPNRCMNLLPSEVNRAKRIFWNY